MAGQSDGERLPSYHKGQKREDVYDLMVLLVVSSYLVLSIFSDLTLNSDNHFLPYTCMCLNKYSLLSLKGK